MSPVLPPRFYLSGTDTDVGKTVTAAVLCAALDIAYWKPVQAGLDTETDSARVARLAGVKVYPERYRLKRPASPHRAAEDEEICIQPTDFTMPEADQLLVEGAGGLMVPFGPQFWQTDLIQHLDLPVILVSRSTLGTLNHTFLTLEAIRARRLPLHGMILVGPEHHENRTDLQEMGDCPVLAQLPLVDDPDLAFPELVASMKRQLAGV